MNWELWVGLATSLCVFGLAVWIALRSHRK